MQSPRALTLLEVMVAGTILGVVLSATAAALSFGFNSTKHARRLAAAERLAGSHLETLLVEHARGPVPARGSIRFNEEGQQDPAGLFTSTWSLEPNRPVSGAFRLAVEVVWVDHSERRLRIATYLPRGSDP